MNILVPSPLKRGDTIGIVAPAAPLCTINKENIELGVQNLQRMGFKVKFGEYVNLSLGDKASGKKRAEDIMNMFADSGISCIMAVLGGYSSIETLEHIDFDVIRCNPKNFIGFSDITMLNIALFEKAHLLNYYGPSFAIFCQKNVPKYTEEYFLNMLMEDKFIEIKSSHHYADDRWYVKNDGNRQWKVNEGILIVRDGEFEGSCLGGNLETLLALAGTTFFPDMGGKVLFLEEANNKSEEEVRRKLMQLKLMGAFEHIQALLFGRFWGWGQEKQSQFLSYICTNLLSEYIFPIMANVDFGHSDPMCTLPVGGKIIYREKKLRMKK